MTIAHSCFENYENHDERDWKVDNYLTFGFVLRLTVQTVLNEIVSLALTIRKGPEAVSVRSGDLEDNALDMRNGEQNP